MIGKHLDFLSKDRGRRHMLLDSDKVSATDHLVSIDIVEVENELVLYPRVTYQERS